MSYVWALLVRDNRQALGIAAFLVILNALLITYVYVNSLVFMDHLILIVALEFLLVLGCICLYRENRKGDGTE
jgi:hypothetical protein